MLELESKPVIDRYPSVGGGGSRGGADRWLNCYKRKGKLFEWDLGGVAGWFGLTWLGWLAVWLGLAPQYKAKVQHTRSLDFSRITHTAGVGDGWEGQEERRQGQGFRGGGGRGTTCQWGGGGSGGGPTDIRQKAV